MAIQGEILTLFKDKEKTQGVFPRTKVSAISDEDGVGLDALLADINTSLGSKAAETHTHTPASIGAATADSVGVGLNNTNTSGISTYPQTCGAHRVTTTLPTGMPTDAHGYGTLFIVNGGSYVMHTYIDYRNSVWMTRTDGVYTPSADAWSRLAVVEYNSSTNTLNFVM